MPLPIFKMIEIQNKRVEVPQIYTAWDLEQAKKFFSFEAIENYLFLRSFGE